MPVFLVAPLVWRFIVDRPEERGLRVDGDPPVTETRPLSEKAPVPPWSSRQALSEPLFWMVCLGFGPCFAITSSIVLIFYTLATDRGFTGAEAALLMACLAWMAALGKPTFGWLVDRMSLRATLLLSTGTQILGLLLILQA
ncbi:MAG: MFS transporter, partial [Planctomycetaceae bacterium]